MSGINLWDPSHLSGMVALATAFLLGVVHGVTPDEHTWPITFSYSVGSYSTRGGMRAGFLFSAAFTVQRALASELAYFALTSFQLRPRWGFAIYLLVGIVMLATGLPILRRDRGVRHGADGAGGSGAAAGRSRALPRYMPLVHGFIAGWGVGAFAAIIYTVLAPAMPSPWVAWMPGALFGLGTMAMQVVLGGAFGAWMARRRFSDTARAYVGRMMGGRMLTGVGIAFVAMAVAGLIWPRRVNGLGIQTPLQIHNLHNIGVGFFLAVIVLFGVAAWAFWKSSREATRYFPPTGAPRPG